MNLHTETRRSSDTTRHTECLGEPFRRHIVLFLLVPETEDLDTERLLHLCSRGCRCTSFWLTVGGQSLMHTHPHLDATILAMESPSEALAWHQWKSTELVYYNCTSHALAILP